MTAFWEVLTVNVDHDRPPIQQDDAHELVNRLRKVFDSSREGEYEIIIYFTGHLTRDASIILRQFFDAKDAFYASSDIIAFPGHGSPLRCIRLVGAHLHKKDELDKSVETDGSEVDLNYTQDFLGLEP
jgi:hypothetical protein